MIIPTPNYVLIEPVQKETETKSGIVLPEAKTQVPQEAVIIAMGERTNEKGEKIEVSYKVGDRVIFKKWEGIEFNPDGPTGKKYLIIKHQDVLAIVEKEVNN